jgi:2-polyprenyl-3-methyl-5-hydroxy-6-metoxy-1,4-benzoquinol methylase
MLLSLKMAISVFWSKRIWPERVVLGVHNAFIVAHHLARYGFAKKFVKKNDLVLDAACGSGYGSAILAKRAKKVYGIDNSKKTILLAKLRYGKENISFLQMDCLNLNFKRNMFDKVISLETLEHLKDPEKFLGEVKKVLKKDGLFIVSTPNGKDNKDEFALPDNPWHFKDYSVEEFKRLLREYFRKVDIYSQIYSKKIKKYRQKHEQVQKIKKKIVKKDKMVLRRVLPRPLKDFLWNMYTRISLKKEAEKITVDDFLVKKGFFKDAEILIGVCRGQ